MVKNKKGIFIDMTESGNGGGMTIDGKYVFATTTARDTYFTTNPTEKKVGVRISVGAIFQEWNGTSWTDKTAMLQGQKGDKGDKGDTGPIGPVGPVGPAGSGTGGGVENINDLNSLKLLEPTQTTTVQVKGIGIYVYDPNSTARENGVRVIKPNTATGRWIRQSSKQRNDFDWHPIDHGAGAAFIAAKENGRLVTGGLGSWDSNAEKGIITCNELIGDNKIVKFRINNVNCYPTFFLSANGTSTVLSQANFRAFTVSITSGTLSIKKQVGATKTTLKTLAVGAICDVIVTKYGNMCSVKVLNPLNGNFINEYKWEDTDLTAFGNTFGFSNADANYSKFSNIEIKDLTSVGKHIVIDGDSQTADGGVKNGNATYQIFGSKLVNKNCVMTNFSYSGKKLQNTIDTLATIIASKSAVYENIFYINMGTNDTGTDSAATMLSKLDTIISTLKTAGFKIAVSTIAIMGVATGVLASYNAGIRDRKTAGTIDYLFDMWDSKWGIVDGTNGVYRKYTLIDNLHYTPVLRNIIADGIVETLGVSLMDNVFVDTLEDEFVDGIPMGDEDYLIVKNAFDKRYNTANDVPEGTIKKFNNYYEDLAALKAVNTSSYTTSTFAEVGTLGRYKFVVGSTDIGNDISVISPTTGSSIGKWILQNNKFLGSVVPSAAIITAISDIFHISGATAISTINPPYNKFVGTITIIPDGSFSFDTTGNIAESYTATVNRTIKLTYDGTKWYRT